MTLIDADTFLTVVWMALAGITLLAVLAPIGYSPKCHECTTRRVKEREAAKVPRK